MLGWLTASPIRQAITFLIILISAYIFFSRPVEYAGDVALYQNSVYLAAGRDGIHVLNASNLDDLRLEQHIPINGRVNTVDVIDNILFAATGADGIRVYNLANPNRPLEIGHYNTNGNATDLSIHDNTLFIADGRSGVHFVQYSGDQHLSFSERGSYRTRGIPVKVIASGNRLYVSDRRNFFSIININDLGNPRLLGEVNLRTRVNQIQVIGQNAYLATEDNGFVVLDISNPEQLGDATRIAYNTPGNVKDFSIHANFAYIADGRGGLRVLDIEDLNRIREVGHASTPGDASQLIYTDDAIFIADGYMGLTVLEADVRIGMRERDSTDNRILPNAISISENYIFIAAGQQGIRVIDVSEPTAPFLVQQFTQAAFAADIVTEGDVGYLADQVEGVLILEISDPLSGIRQVGNAILTPGEAQSLLLTDDFLYLADGTAGIRIFDKTIPAEPVYVGELDTPGSATRLAIVDSTLYVADLDAGLRMVNVSDPRAPIEVGGFDTPGEARAVSVLPVAGNNPRKIAYIADGALGLQVLDVTNPRNIIAGQRIAARHFYENLAIRNGYLFIASRGEGVLIFDLQNPLSPALIGVFSGSANPIDFTFSESILFTADRLHGLRIASIANLAAPNEIGFFDLPSGARAFVLGDEIVYLVDGQQGLWLLNRSNIGSFTLRDFVQSIANAQMVRVFGDRAYIMEWEAGVEIIDLSSGAYPTIGSINTPGAAKDIRVVDQTAYVADGPRGLMIYDISDPKNPHETGSLDTQGDAQALEINERYAYIADGTNGLYVARITETGNPVRVSVSREPSDAHSVTSVGNYVYVAGGESGFHIYDMTRPLVPIHVSNVRTVSPVNDVSIVGLYAFLALNDGTIRVLDISNPSNPEFVGEVNTDPPALRLSVFEYESDAGRPLQFGIYVATDSNGLQVLSGEKELETQLLARHNTSGTPPFSKMFEYLVLLIRGGDLDQPSKAAHTFRQVGFDVFIIGCGGLILLLLIFAQFILPTVTLQERSASAYRLIKYMLGGHGPAVHIRNGELKERPGEQERQGPGVMLVDLSSAAVLIRRGIPMPMVSALIRSTFLGIRNRLSGILNRQESVPQEPDLRVVGPGLVFTGAQSSPNRPRYYEVVHGVADLRPQSRAQSAVRAYTRDGIEVESTVFTVFTIGEKADVYFVSYIGDRVAQNLRIIKIENVISAKDTGNVQSYLKRVVNIEDQLDPQDREEIHRILRQKVIGIENPGPFDILEPQQASPFMFDEKRVFQAVAADAHNVDKEGDQKWTDLPVMVATEFFRQMIAKEIYDRLYDKDAQGKYSLNDLKQQFSYKIRNLGILAFRYIELKDGRDFEENNDYHINQINAYGPRELETPKSLRVRGIKVKFAGFSELYPVSQQIADQKVDYWKAHWEADALKKRAPLSLDASRIRNEGRKLGQQELVMKLAKVFQAGAENRQALALRLFQTLEDASVNPATRLLLPDATISLMSQVSIWLQESSTSIKPQEEIVESVDTVQAEDIEAVKDEDDKADESTPSADDGESDE